VEDGFLKEYLEEGQEASAVVIPTVDQGHEVPVHGEVNTISRRFSGGGCTTSQRKKYAREVMAVEARETDQSPELDIYFTKADLQVSFNKLQLSLDQLRPYDDCLYNFSGDQVEVRGHVELKTTFSDDTSSRTINIGYLVVNASSAYNIFLGRPSLNRLGAMASTRHMKMKLPSLEERVITIKYDQKATKKCYENILKTKKRSMLDHRPTSRGRRGHLCRDCPGKAT